jgi:membrane protease YdiL (CAAX protease family)
MSRAALATWVLEGALVLAGLILLWRILLGKRPGRDADQRRLGAWNLPAIDFAGFLSVALLSAAVAASAGAWLARAAGLGADASLVAGGAAMHVGILIGLLAFHRAYGARAGAAPVFFPALRGGIATFLVAMPLVSAAGLGWSYVMTALGLPADSQDLMDVLENTGSPGVKAGLLAVAVLLVPVTEELVFRAGLFRYLRTRMPRAAAILLTSSLFAALHVNWGPHPTGLPSLLPLIVLAAVYCVAYERTGSIGTTIVAHALFNLNTFVVVASGIAS